MTKKKKPTTRRQSAQERDAARAVCDAAIEVREWQVRIHKRMSVEEMDAARVAEDRLMVATDRLRRLLGRPLLPREEEYDADKARAALETAAERYWIQRDAERAVIEAVRRDAAHFRQGAPVLAALAKHDKVGRSRG